MTTIIRTILAASAVYLLYALVAFAGGRVPWPLMPVAEYTAVEQYQDRNIHRLNMEVAGKKKAARAAATISAIEAAHAKPTTSLDELIRIVQDER